MVTLKHFLYKSVVKVLWTQLAQHRDRCLAFAKTLESFVIQKDREYFHKLSNNKIYVELKQQKENNCPDFSHGMETY